ncbi:MAG: pilus assembly protein [Rhodospirillales bacterium]|nr:pilus assembly protein [Rhodospirillales bacterium]MCB9994982.1 pilus assembly protein [Rhodospirillales bacterium]
MYCVRQNKIYQWLDREDGVAAAEFALVFPVLFVMMIGVWDVGNALIVNQKAIAAAQIAVDLVGREEVVDDDELAQAFQAATLALQPYDTTSLEIDVVSVEFDEDDNPVVNWQESSSGTTDPTLADRTAGLGTEGGGAIVVEVRYDYEPTFAGTVIGNIEMRERMFTRGRQSAVVTRN